jgi:hypothetical protein
MLDQNPTTVDAENVAAERSARSAYHSPTLLDYGEVRELTQTGPFNVVS